MGGQGLKTSLSVLGMMTCLILASSCSQFSRICGKNRPINIPPMVHNGAGEAEYLLAWQNNEPGVVIEDNEIFQNNRVGLRVRGSTPVMVRHCSFYRNGRSGLRLEMHAKVLVDRSNIYKNGTGGMDIVDADRVTCLKTGIFQNQAGGIRIRKGIYSAYSPTWIKIWGGRIYLNDQAGILVTPTVPSRVNISVSETRIFDNGQAGIRIVDGTYLRAWRNAIFSNSLAGVSAVCLAEHPPVMDIFENKIFFNQQAGIIVQGGMTGTVGISNNWIYNNARSGIAAGLGKDFKRKPTSLEIYHNVIVANGSSQEGAGIRNGSNGTMDIENNIIAYNFRAGILTSRCRDTSHNLLFANGETSDFDPSNGYSYLIERLQYGGCPGRGSGDILADPLFSAPDIYDFSLMENSPAIGAAKRLDLPYFKAFTRPDMGTLLIPGTSRHKEDR